MSVVFRVYGSSYEGDWTIGVYEDEAAAVAFAREQARKTNEEFTGRVGHGVGIERLDSESGCAEDLTGWQDWETTIRGGRFVVARGEKA